MGTYFNRKNQKKRRQRLRNNATYAERMLWLRLKGRQIEGCKFRRQFGIGYYIVDFYCPELQLAIEADGESHEVPGALQKDEIRQRDIEAHDIRVLRFRNEEIIDDGEGVAEQIRAVVVRLKNSR